ncbi:hypothetical protein [Sporosarcina sp. JAI121]|uniref:hypothetical protein n=1 Tax=Sporosarcina sp. JAI121 TaxID=2723064 RepID=UPI0015CAC745|nr:hypothetical protein [Sporosarcina sp. JAI121]NYF23549.1 hypothetical protein [Sporosarcina sp. JAI121]
MPNATGTITLDAGTLTGNLTVNTANATFVNNATVGGTVFINNVSANTWNENGVGNKLNFNDPDAGTKLVIGAGKTVASLTLNKPAIVTIPATSTVTDLTVASTATGASINNNGTVTILTSNAATTVVGNGTVNNTAGTAESQITVGEDVKVENGAHETIAPLISEGYINSDGPNRINVGFKVNEDIDLSLTSKADIVISYFTVENGVETAIKTTPASNNLVKNKTWAGYLNDLNGNKYSKSNGNLYSNELVKDTLVITTVDPKYANMAYVNNEWVGNSAIRVKVVVIDNAGNRSETLTLNFPN